jgi:triosephosphate isomerase
MLEIKEFNKIIVANWKLNGSSEFLEAYFEELDLKEINSDICGIVCPPITYFQNCYSKLHSLHLGGQDCSKFKEGAYTGEISASMLRESNCEFCIVGHSERRQVFNEKNEEIKLKAELLLEEKIIPIICIGETFEQKKANETKKILKEQIIKSLPRKTSNELVVIAYEPIWAIGSGITPSPQEINNIHEYLKKEIQDIQGYKILYGGSVNSNNANEIMSLENVDGVLVGGASLKPKQFSEILRA